MDNLTKEQRRKNMQAIKSKATKMEVILAKIFLLEPYRKTVSLQVVVGSIHAK